MQAYGGLFFEKSGEAIVLKMEVKKAALEQDVSDAKKEFEGLCKEYKLKASDVAQNLALTQYNVRGATAMMAMPYGGEAKAAGQVLVDDDDDDSVAGVMLKPSQLHKLKNAYQQLYQVTEELHYYETIVNNLDKSQKYRLNLQELRELGF